MKNNYEHLFFIAFLLFSGSVWAQNWSHKPSEVKGFIENKAQFNHLRTAGGEVPKYVYDGNNEDFLMGIKGFTIKMREIQFNEMAELREEEQRERGKNKFDKPGEYAEEERKERMERDSKVIRDEVTYEWIGANPNATLLLDETNSYYHSYWYTDANGQQINTSNIRSGKRLLCKDLYPGIDAVYEFYPEGGLKYSLIVHPGANPAQAQLKSSKKAKLSENGRLVTKTRLGDITEHAPVCYYTDAPEHIVSSQFSYSNRTTSFNVAHTQITKTLVIDPWIQSPTFNTNWDCVWECDRDAAGNVYAIGGVMPLQLIKYNAAGVLQWTYSTPYDTSNGWLGTMATDLNGNTYVTNGTAEAIQKISPAGAVVWNNANPVGGINLTEFWSISFNCDQTELFIGGTGGALTPVPFVYRVNAATGAVSSSQQVSFSPSLFGSDGGNEVRSVTAGKNGRYYYLTHDTLGIIPQTGSACGGASQNNYKTPNGYKLGYKCENFRANNTGIQALKSFGDFLFINRGDRLEKRDFITGELLDSVNIPSGQFNVTVVPIFNITISEVGNNGIDIDDCGTIYVGSTNGVYSFSQNLVQQGNFPTNFKVYDVAVSDAGNIIACGSNGDANASVRSGSVQSFSASACAPQAEVCCNAAICEVPELCNDDAPFQLTTVGSGGTWTGTGVSASGLFNPANVGEGTFEVTYQLACGSETVSITVNNCSAMSVCEETDGTYSVDGGTGPYSWEYFTPQQTIQITNQAQCEACGYTWFFGSCLNGFFPAESCTVPESWTEYAMGTNAPPPTIFPSRVTNSAGTEYIINSGDEIVPCTECPADTIDITISACESYTNPLGAELTQSGVYSYTLQNAAECDSIIRLDLTINNPTSSTTTLSICSGQLPYTWNGITFTAAGVQSATLQSVAGCDSLATLNLTVSNQLTSTTNLTVCEAQIPYTWNGITFTAPGTQSANLFTEAGCDSVATLILDVAQQLISNTDIAICDVQLPYTWNGITFSESGSQSVTLTSTAGCDSIATLNLSVNSFVPFTDVQTACETFTWIDGNTYTSSTNVPVYTITGGSAAGCDSVITLNLTVNQNATGQNSITSCGPYTNEVGQVFEQSTSYNFVLPTSEGCDSVVTVNITVLPLPDVTASASSTSIYVGDSVQLDANGAEFYLWSPETGLNCTNCESPIAMPLATATYVVTGTDTAGCATSDTIRIEVDIRCNEPFIPTIFSPNGKGPVANELLCLFSNCVDQLKFVVYNRWGELVFETDDITKCWDGFYKGTEASSGIYAYNLYILQLDGNVVNKTGTITLVK
ncbi:MAG: gliding motility-associated C-terminal domain-containing protein [Bacteroidia bacterium]